MGSLLHREFFVLKGGWVLAEERDTDVGRAWFGFLSRVFSSLPPVFKSL